jgi:molybdenum cofactor synthesis domain-containing protein
MKNPPTAAIMIVGNEILSGRTQDINIQFIAERLAGRGIKLAEVRVVRDEEAAVIKAARELSKEYDYVFSTGGIGPTHDDITAECIAKAFNTVLEINAEAKRRMEEFYASRGTVMNEGRLRMARIPAGAELIDNSISAAPGFKVGNVYVMAGVPKIMQVMFLSIEQTLAQGAPMLSNTVSCSMKEGDIAIEMEGIQKQFPDVEIGSYPLMVDSGHTLNLVLRGTDEKLLKTATDKIVAMVKHLDQNPVITYQRPPSSPPQKGPKP